jgi:hypothetical protein
MAVVLRQTAIVSLIAMSVHLVSIHEVIAQTSNSSEVVQFDIPAQPLASALRAYGQATGLELFYDGSLSIGRSTSGIKGAFTPALALKQLLKGTGYVARQTDIANTVTIVEAPPIAPLRQLFDRYQPYFARVQASLGAKLCDEDKADQEITLRFWLDRSGVISQAELVGPSASDDDRRKITAKVLGVGVGKAPPPDLPEPLTMIIYPPSIRDAQSCPLSDSGNADQLAPR